MSSQGVGLGSSKKGRTADCSMVARNTRIVAQGKADATYADTQKKNPFRLSSAILNGGSYAGETLVRQNMQNNPPSVAPSPAPAPAPAPSPAPPPEPTGTLQFGGTSYMRILNRDGLQLGTGNFTIEWWMNMIPGGPEDPPQYPRVFTFSETGTNQTYGVSIEGFGTSRRFYVWNKRPGGFNNISFEFPVSLYNSWHHFAIVGEGGNKITVYIDGATNVAPTTQTFSVTYNMSDVSGTSALSIGSYPQSTTPQSAVAFKGSITNFRIVKGTAVYTAPFTRPSSPLTAIPGTTILFLFDNQNNPRNESVSNSTSGVAFVGTGGAGGVNTAPGWSLQSVF